MDGKFKRSTRWSFAACLATFLLLRHITAIMSNFRLSLLRFRMSSFGLVGSRSTRVAESTPISAQISCICVICSFVLLGGKGVAISWYPSCAALVISSEVCFLSLMFAFTCKSL